MHQRAAATVVLLSGGIDSLVCALLAQRDEPDFTALCIGYGQNQCEIDAAKGLVAHYKWTLVGVQITPFPRSLDPAGTNLIPGRNAMFLSLASALLPVEGGRIYIGSNADDQADYPDCRLEFFNAFEQVQATQGRKVIVKHPLINLTKKQIVAEARRRGAPIEETVSCYLDRHCGQCNACRLRDAALAT